MRLCGYSLGAFWTGGEEAIKGGPANYTQTHLELSGVSKLKYCMAYSETCLTETDEPQGTGPSLPHTAVHFLLVQKTLYSGKRLEGHYGIYTHEIMSLF